MKWYRVQVQRWAGPVDEFGDSGIGRTCLELRDYEVIKETPKGVWIDCGFRKFVLRGAKRQFASPTKELALEKFLKRKERHLGILETQIDEVRQSIVVARHWQEDGIPESKSQDIARLIGIF